MMVEHLFSVEVNQLSSAKTRWKKKTTWKPTEYILQSNSKEKANL